MVPCCFWRDLLALRKRFQPIPKPGKYLAISLLGLVWADLARGDPPVAEPAVTTSTTLLLPDVSLPIATQDEPAPAAALPFQEVVIPAPLLSPPKPSKPAEQPTKPATSAAPDRWWLMRQLQGTWPGWVLDDARMQISGWTEQSFTGSSVGPILLPIGFNYLGNQYMLQQNWLRFERRVVTSGTSTPSFGFRSDWILPGTDYMYTLPRGIFNSQLTADNGQPATYGIDPIQFYGEAYFPNIGRGLDVKVGRFFSLYGVESNEAVSNVLVSHVYTFLYNPFTQTGLVSTLPLSNTWTVQAGLVAGNDTFIDVVDNPTYIGNVRWTRPDQNESLLFNVILDKGQYDQAHAFHNPEVFDLVYTHRLNQRLNYTFDGLYGFTTNVPNTGFANWMGLVQYLTYDFTSRLSGTARLEFFDDFQGQRTNFQGLYTDMTTGINWRMRKGIIIRPEVRYDYNSQSRPFEGQHGLLTATFDLIVRW